MVEKNSPEPVAEVRTAVATGRIATDHTVAIVEGTAVEVVRTAAVVDSIVDSLVDSTGRVQQLALNNSG
ncbi:unnamed protein product [Strongylus vulgaris]|uniref:Uncharacterized protein n=1 Tax=Strongylus vulgaris TaxID=40348 RepID=A0A3P7K7M0_STRVU|nr:unnamed protein product [Strongylus vulgaris]